MDADSLLKWAKEFGVFAAMFLGLLVWVLKTSAKREERLMQFQDKMAERLGIVDDIKEAVGRIEIYIQSRARAGGNGD